MELEAEPDLSIWTAKPPPIRPVDHHRSQDIRDAQSGSDQSPPQSSEESGFAGDILYNGSRPVTAQRAKSLEEAEDEDEDVLSEFSSQSQHGFYIDLPYMADAEKEQYRYAPGHFEVTEIIAETRPGHFIVRLASGEKQRTRGFRQLTRLYGGQAALKTFRQNTLRMTNRGRRSASGRKSAGGGMVDWSQLGRSDSDGSQGLVLRGRRRRKGQNNDSEIEVMDAMDEYSQEDDEGVPEVDSDQGEDADEPTGRRSSRLKGTRRMNYAQPELDLDALTQSPRRLRGRPPFRPTRGGGRLARGRRTSPSPSPEPTLGTRRSERTRAKAVGSMRERLEDEISAHSESDTGQKVIGTKEVFRRLHEHDPFRKRHRQECDTCDIRGDNPSKGPLIFCQGCTTAYHKTCLGFRGTRDHLVTKIGEENFVLQCRRCIGVAHDKDPIAPHLGHCEGCHESALNSSPFRARLTTKQEQTQREENGGKDPITIVDEDHINKVENILFRCFSCQRGWHMHHLPDRMTINSTIEDEEEEEKELSEADRAEKRWQLYHRGWRCKDCIENKHAIDALVGWRPIDLESYTPGYHADMVQESHKEYLVKWRNKSYLRVTWMPGSWVWGTAAGAMRGSFNKKPENFVPRMTTKDAVPEEYLRVDIVFDVRYTSVVRNTSKAVDHARVREVESAFVKYKGLGYEDAIWESPPSFQDTERWSDFASAYDDYVVKLHTSIPSRSTLNRHLTHIRSQDFEKTLIRKEQPSNLTGGTIMKYQLEGLNWLYYQWITNQNAILADEMGLGKTIQLIAFFATLVQEHKCWPFLVVVPNSTCPNWRREIKTWAPSLRVVTYYGSSYARKLTHDYELFPDDISKKRRPGDPKDIKAHIVIASYESVVEDKTRNSLKSVPWQGLVVDEGQRLKNDKNQVYEVLSKNFKFPFKVLLTGTPLQNNVRELFNLLQFLDKSVNAAEMEAKYAELTQENVPDLHDKLRKFFLRRTKAQVLTSLPPMAQIIVPVSMSPLQKKVYKSILAKNPVLVKSIFSRDPTTATKERVSLNNILIQLRKTLCHPFVYSREIEERNHDSTVTHARLVDASAKLQLLSIMLPKLKDRGHRVLLFSQFLDNLDIMEDFLDGLGFMHRRLDGSTSSLDKQKKIDEFNAPDSPYFAFLLSTRAGGVGINLATADTVIILDPDFNPHQDIQALSRAHRIGQKNKVLIFQLMTKASAEEKIMQIGKKKMALDHVLIERMDQDDEAGIDLESILRHGAEALFDDDPNAADGDIIYDGPSIDKLLDRTQVEDTKISEEQSAESQFSFARVWANKKAAFEDALSVEATGNNTPNPSMWDKILKERERAYEEEMALKVETFGRGKRKRYNVDYGQHGVDGDTQSPIKRKRRGDGSDGEFAGRETEQEETEASSDDGSDANKRPTFKARPFKRVKVPTGPAPYAHSGVDGDLALEWLRKDGTMPPEHDCSACLTRHPMGWCRLKVAGVEHCGLCGLAHLGHMRTCPHLSNEHQVARLLETLKESPEPRDQVEAATKYLRMVRGDLVSRRRKKDEQEKARVQMHQMQSDLNRP